MRWIVDNRPPAWLWAVAVGLLILVGSVVIAGSEPAYVPLTIEQAAAYIRTNPDEAARDIVRLDWIEHVAPTVTLPPELFTVAGRDLAWAWQGPLSIVWGPFPDPIGSAVPMRYDSTLPDGRQAGLVPDRSGDVLFWEIMAVVCTVIGAGAGYAVHR